MFEGIEGVSLTSDFAPEDQIKLAIVGLPKSGKSTTAVTCEPPVFVADCDDRKASIAGKPGVYVKTYFDYDKSHPTAFQSLETDIRMFEYQKSIGQEIPKTFVFDSVTWLASHALNYYFESNSAGKTVLQMAGGKQIIVPRGYDPWAAESGLIEDLIKRAFRLGHVICIFHEGPEKDATSTSETPVYTGRVSISPPRLVKLLTMFNEVWRQIVDQYTGEFKLITKPNATFLGATALSIDAEEPPNIMKLLEKHRERYKSAHLSDEAFSDAVRG